LGRSGSSEQVTLNLVAAEITESFTLLDGLDTLGDRDEVEGSGDSEHRGDDGGVPRIVLDSSHEAGVDLDGINRVPLGRIGDCETSRSAAC
jgi:hypothetical protein